MKNPKEYCDWLPMTGEPFLPYLNPRVNPALKTSALQLDALVGGERRGLKSPTAGDLSLVLTYQGYEGALTSLEQKETDLEILQLQGARGRKGFRVNSGLHVVSFFGDTIGRLADEPASPFERITMKSPEDLVGDDQGLTEGNLAKYAQLGAKLHLVYSREEKLYVRDVNRKNTR